MGTKGKQYDFKKNPLLKSNPTSLVNSLYVVRNSKYSLSLSLSLCGNHSIYYAFTTYYSTLLSDTHSSPCCHLYYIHIHTAEIIYKWIRQQQQWQKATTSTSEYMPCICEVAYANGRDVTVMCRCFCAAVQVCVSLCTCVRVLTHQRQCGSIEPSSVSSMANNHNEQFARIGIDVTRIHNERHNEHTRIHTLHS